MEVKKEKCKLNAGGFTRICAGMKSVISGSRPYGAGGGRGLYRMALTNIKTGKPSRFFVVLKEGEQIKRGIVLNLCPFCGGELAKDSTKTRPLESRSKA